ncbi:MAG: hypothetical protein GY870_01640 [archaeon]|nr:hypothetical protein [archaeon]
MQQCQICGRKTNLLKTEIKNCYSYNLGKFTLVAGSTFCPSHKYLELQSNKIVKYQSELAMLIVDKNNRICFDLIVKIARLRYDNHCQLKEIQSYLKCSAAKIDLPISTIGMIAKRFLLFCYLLHEKYTTRIREDIRSNGGYFLHFDGTTENKSDTFNLLILDSLSGHVLKSVMIENETYTDVKEALEKVYSKYGAPLATISDLKNCFLKVCEDVFGETVIHIFCHYHFLKTFKDDFSPYHQLLKNYLGPKVKLKSTILTQLKKLNEVLPNITTSLPNSIEKIEKYWIETADTLNSYRLVLQWILKYNQDSYGKGVPFDLPFLDFYNRYVKGKKLIRKIFKNAIPVYRLKYYKLGFCVVIEKMKKGSKEAALFYNAIIHLEYLKKWFQKLRGALFLEGNADDVDVLLSPLSKRYNLTLQEAKAIPQKLDYYIEKLNYELSQKVDTNKKSVIKRFKKQVEKYKKNLLVPIMTSYNRDGQKLTLVPQRTNNCMESFFRLIKGHLRRCTGRTRLSKEFASIGSLLPYYISMKKQNIFSDIFDNDCILSDEFAKLCKQQCDITENIIKWRIKSNKKKFKDKILSQA